MKNLLFSLLSILTVASVFAQKEVTSIAELKKVTVFFTGAQIQHEGKVELKPGKQEVVFQKLTDFIDPNTVQVKAMGDLTILSVRTKKNYEDQKISSEEINQLNAKRKALETKDQTLRDEYTILEMDKNLLMRNRDLKGYNEGLKTAELKEAYAFMHQKLSEITTRQSQIFDELEDLLKSMNKLEQEIISQRSKPVINYSEIVVEVDVEKATNATFVFNYISPRATWKPYYDMRSDGIGKPIRLEAKANVSQTTGIEWKNVDMVLSTNDPYQNAQEPTLNPWYLYYNNYPQQKTQSARSIPTVDYSGEKLRGEVIDASTGEPLPFTKITFWNFPNVGAVTDFDGKFEITVPKGATYAQASYVGYQMSQLQITAAYLKFFLKPEALNLEEVVVTANRRVASEAMSVTAGVTSSMVSGEYDLEATQYKNKNKVMSGKKSKALFDQQSVSQGNTGSWSPTVATVVQKKDMRMEYTILSKMSIPTDGMDHRVSIGSFDLNASYEYHVIPKIDPSVYLAAQVSGWEKLNLMSGESNIYFDGTFMGKSYLDVNSTKDTLSFSFGKDNKISVDRTRIKEKSKTKTIGSRQKFDITWELKIKNNGGAMIPFVIKDQFPVSNNEDIKVKNGDYSNGKLDEKTGIITWSFLKGITGTQTITFDYGVDYQNGMLLYLE
ncbi:MAG: mucoidy inhibitor MuiA family protein [Flavobacteriales bacterium]|nr:mucoidy inhibitor MuiA family protein [Flavobacteriales bacterium]NCA20439.1 mucoidy inhibitor MuiA family protein [Crocinitomicaceae bacterium]